MDSGNSGSLQSSSGGGGDEEYGDSTTDSISAFLNSSASHHMPNPPPPSSSSSSSHYPYPPPPPPPSSSSSPLFDPLSNYFDVFSRSTPSQNPISPLNLDIGVWSRAFASQPISTPTHMMPPSSLTQPTTLHANPNPSFSLPQGLDPSPPSILTNQTAAPRPSKKRSRASRRAPTTVLTTDTTNFRAMVQEFTGIPAPPFSASPFPSTSRFDLFNNTASSALRSGHLEPPPYLLRPFAHKGHPPPFHFSSAANMNLGSGSNSTSSSNYQLLSELGIPKGNSMHNPILRTFAQSLQQPNSSDLVESSQAPLPHARSMEQFNFQQRTTDHLNELHNFANVSRVDDQRSKNYATHTQLVSDSAQLISDSAECQVNQPSSSAQHEKGSDQNVISKTAVATTTGQGMVDSWICSSD